MNGYVLRTDKSWQETMWDLEEQMRLWGVDDWATNKPSGSRSTDLNQTEPARAVKLSYTKAGHTVTLVMGTQERAVDNLRVLYLAVEAMRLNERRGISDVIRSAYLQLSAPEADIDPYEVLEIRAGASLEVAEAAYKAKVRAAHPDSGGSVDMMKQLNKAIDDIRKSIK